MANTYTQIYIHVVFAVQGRYNLLKKGNKEEYLEMLKKFNIEYDEKYLFDWIEEEEN